MASGVMLFAFLVAGALLTALGARLMIRRWPLQFEDLLGYFGLLAADESLADGAGVETESSRRRRRRPRRRGGRKAAAAVDPQPGAVGPVDAGAAADPSDAPEGSGESPTRPPADRPDPGR